MSALKVRLAAVWAGVPDGVKLVLRDVLEAAIAAAGTLTFTVPLSVADARQQALVAWFAVSAAIIAVLRREALPAVKAWLFALFTGGAGG